MPAQEVIEFPAAVYTIWWAALAVTVVVIVPLAVGLLHRTWRAAREIQRYTGEALAAGLGIATHTGGVKALEETITTAGRLLERAAAVGEQSGALEGLFSERLK